jgi:thymidylate synthase (FAD)
MIVIEPSFEIQEDLDHLPLAVRLEMCGRVCYRSEDKITADSAIPFVRRIAAHGHNSVLEMAVVHFHVRCGETAQNELFAAQPKYLVVDQIDDQLLVTGSIRAFRELCHNPAQPRIVAAIVEVLAQEEPYLFENLPLDDSTESRGRDVQVTRLKPGEIDALPAKLCLRHRFVSVRMVVNRAVTHELVRHRPCSFLQESQRYCRYSQDKFSNQVTFIKPMFFEEGSAEYQLWADSMLMSEKAYLKLLETATPQAARTVLANSCKTEIIVYCNLAEWQHIFTLRTSAAAEPSMREIMIPLAEAMCQKFGVLEDVGQTR